MVKLCGGVLADGKYSVWMCTDVVTAYCMQIFAMFRLTALANAHSYCLPNGNKCIHPLPHLPPPTIVLLMVIDHLI